MRKILALDQASRITGWAVFEDSKLLEFGKFEATEQDIGERLYEIKGHVKDLISKYGITEVVFEDIQLQNNVVNNVQTFKVLAEVYGVIDELLVELQIPHTSVLASSWKSTLSIKGKTRSEQKKNAQLFVQNTYNVKPTQDESDAICIGTHYLSNKASRVFSDKGMDWSK